MIRVKKYEFCGFTPDLLCLCWKCFYESGIGARVGMFLLTKTIVAFVFYMHGKGAK